MFRGGLPELLKEGYKHFSGVEEAILKNIDAVRQLAQMTRTSLGPNGMNKMVINHLDKLFVTNDAATIIRELDVVHPAAKMIAQAAQMQEQEIGDATNFVVVFAGELLNQAEALIRTGLHPSDIIAGYDKAGKKALEFLESLSVRKLEDIKNVKEVAKFLKPPLSKKFGFEDTLAPLVAQACIQVLPKNPKFFNVDNVRVCKILGGGLDDSSVLKGFVLTRDTEGTIKHIKNAKVAAFATGIDTAKTETKGTVIFTNAEELQNYSKSEEKYIEDIVKQIADSGANVVISGGPIGEMAMHFIEKYKMLAVKVQSKFDLRRLCKATGATALVRLGAPTKEEMGACDIVNVEEIGSNKVTVFRQENESSAISTIIVRGSTPNVLDDIERAIDDAVNVFKAAVRDNRFCAGAGATEIELSRLLKTYADQNPGLDQYAIKKFAEAFEIIPRTLSENAGLVATDVVSNLYAAHQKGNAHDGIDVLEGTVANAVDLGVVDLLAGKYSAIKLATEAALTILRVDQIIMAKPAGGPKPPKQGPMDADD